MERKNGQLSDEKVAKTSKFGYNPAVEARPLTKEQVALVRSRTQKDPGWLGVENRKVQAHL